MINLLPLWRRCDTILGFPDTWQQSRNLTGMFFLSRLAGRQKTDTIDIQLDLILDALAVHVPSSASRIEKLQSLRMTWAF